MKTKTVQQVAWSLAAGLLAIWLIVAAGQRSRAQSLQSFEAYAPDMPVPERMLCEQRALNVLGNLLSSPELDPILVVNALRVVQSSAEWPNVSSQVHSQLTALLTARRQQALSNDTIEVLDDLLRISNHPDQERWRAELIDLAGPRAPLAAALQTASLELKTAAGDEELKRALSKIDLAWSALLAPLPTGERLHSLARRSEPVAGAEYQAFTVVMGVTRNLLEPYGIAPDRNPEKIFDRAMLDWLDNQARIVSTSQPHIHERLAQAAGVLSRHVDKSEPYPFIETTLRVILRPRALSMSAWVLLAVTLLLLFGGLIYAIRQLIRGPTPVDVNAETMENVEPIDMDTDIETRSRSSASITDVG